MPVVDLNVQRDYTQLVGSPCANEKFKEYILTTMFENIKFRIDEVGAKVENEAVMSMSRSMPRLFIVDRPFWVVMRQKGCHPYFIAQINNTDFMA